jgi:hypothetical protein
VAGDALREKFLFHRLQAGSRRLAGAAIRSQLVADLLAFTKAGHASLFDSADMNENIGAAVVRLDEAEALLDVEPFNSAGSHAPTFLQASLNLAHGHEPLRSIFLEEVFSGAVKRMAKSSA